jgi:peptide/nickel transport system substrate-binding protein
MSAAVSLAMVAILAGGVSAAAPPGAKSAATPQAGGTLTVVENSGDIGAWPVGLDPATNTSVAATDPYMEAIYGDLFEPGQNGKMIPDLASGYKFTDGGKAVSIYLRHGVTFQDGTPFNASAVAWNFRRDFDPKNACICDSSFPVKSITTPNASTVVLHLKEVYAPIIEAFAQASPDFIASPTAYQKMGEDAFRLKPIGAGPFEVVSDTVNSSLVLKKFDHYWQKGHPYLDNLIFKSIGSDQSAYTAIETGQAQLEQQVPTYAVVESAKKNPKMTVTTIPGSGTLGIQLNTTTAPFDNLTAREAIYYATDPQALNKVLVNGAGTISESGDGPASLFPDLVVPGYRTYDLAKAKSLVQQLGGLSFSLTSLAISNLDSEALQSEWEQAGMKVTIQSVNLASLVQAMKANSWDTVVPGGCGGTDPTLGIAGMAWRCLSYGPFTGIHDKHLDQMINSATGTDNMASRARLYKQIFGYLNRQAYLPFTFSAPFYNMAANTVHGPGIDTPLFSPFWESVWVRR